MTLLNVCISWCSSGDCGRRQGCAKGRGEVPASRQRGAAERMASTSLRRQVDALRHASSGTSSGYIQRKKGRPSLLLTPEQVSPASVTRSQHVAGCSLLCWWCLLQLLLLLLEFLCFSSETHFCACSVFRGRGGEEPLFFVLCFLRGHCLCKKKRAFDCRHTGKKWCLRLWKGCHNPALLSLWQIGAHPGHFRYLPSVQNIIYFITVCILIFTGLHRGTAVSYHDMGTAVVASSTQSGGSRSLATI